MSSLALMRWLESAPERYDAGMRALTLGRVTAVHHALAEAATRSAGARVLEIGCGTGTLTAQLIARGAHVTAVDQDAAMLAQAHERLPDTTDSQVTWLERTAAEIDGLPPHSFDAVVASFSLSEMSVGERAFVLRAAANLVTPGGIIAIGDEVRPQKPWCRVLVALLRAPQAALAWLIAGSQSRPISDLRGEIVAAGFRVHSETRWLLGSFAVIVAEAV